MTDYPNEVAYVPSDSIEVRTLKDLHRRRTELTAALAEVQQAITNILLDAIAKAKGDEEIFDAIDNVRGDA